MAEVLELVGSVDQGTSSTRFMLFDKEGDIRFQHQIQIKASSPEPGWLEQDPEEIYQSVLASMEEVMKKVKQSQTNVVVKAIGITNQRETTVMWDKQTGKPLYNALVWSDGRTKDICHRLIEKFGNKNTFADVCGLPISTYFSAVKILWLLEGVPRVKEACELGTCLFGTIDSWLIWKLTGGATHATDVTNASRTLLMNLKTLKWDLDVCSKLGIPTKILPEIRPSAYNFGAITANPFPGVPITGCVGDQQAAMLGQKCVNVGDVKNTYGTGCFMLKNTGKKIIQSKHGLLTTVGYKLGENEDVVYALEGSVAVAGSGVDWLKNNLNIISSPEEIGPLASSVPNTGGIFFVPAFSGLLLPIGERMPEE
eukprot:TRINITY_DN2734_c0_g1_i1.p1 TRINITY_DN2734_c0_g1~~TRINITY_DN2734_c0_g1_i1.p1  ORF type:complete len:368 (+),score=95.32 TRINITY_DN2734_c0_g1_i1:62-1165(+)